MSFKKLVLTTFSVHIYAARMPFGPMAPSLAVEFETETHHDERLGNISRERNWTDQNHRL